MVKKKIPGNDLLSHRVYYCNRKFPVVYAAVPSAMKGLTSVFGMGTGGSPSLWSPGNNYNSLTPDQLSGFSSLTAVRFDSNNNLSCSSKQEKG